MSKQKAVIILLRLGITFTFFYAAISSFLDPNSWVGFFPLFLRNIFPAGLMLTAFSFYEIILGFWLISGKFQFYSATLAALTILGIIVFNLGTLDIIFRDVGLFFASLSLVLLSVDRQFS